MIRRAEVSSILQSLAPGLTNQGTNVLLLFVTDTLPGIGKRHWRSFLPIWLFPIALFLTLVLPGFASHVREYFLFLDFPAFALCCYFALKPWRSGGITFTQMLFWFAVVPLLIWAVMVFGIFGLATVAGQLHI